MGPGFESLKAHQWPVGQAAKTAASHAANVGSIPARVTTYFFLKEKVSKKNFHRQPEGADENTEATGEGRILLGTGVNNRIATYRFGKDGQERNVPGGSKSEAQIKASAQPQESPWKFSLLTFFYKRK